MKRIYTLNQIWDIASGYFSEDSRNMSWNAIVGFLKIDRTKAWMSKDEVLSDEIVEKCFYLLEKLRYKIPINRIIKHRYFWKSEFYISPYTLEPRPETEAIIELSLRYKPRKILDIGTGTGCILLSLLQEHKNAHGVGIDISNFILDTAKYNSRKLGIDNCEFMLCGEYSDPDELSESNVKNKSNVKSKFGSYNSNSESESDTENSKSANKFNSENKFDLIVCNPPYVLTAVDHATKFDPLTALFSDKTIEMTKNLPLDGILLCEVPVYLKNKYENCFKKNYIWHTSSHPEIFIFEYRS